MLYYLYLWIDGKFQEQAYGTIEAAAASYQFMKNEYNVTKARVLKVDLKREKKLQLIFKGGYDKMLYVIAAGVILLSALDYVFENV